MDILKPLIALLAIVNPIGVLPFFLHFTEGFSREQRRRTIRVAAVSAFVVIAVSAVPPAVAAHVLHLTAAVSRLTPKAAMAVESVSIPEPAAQESLEAEDPEVLQEPVHTPVDEPVVTEEPEPVTEPEKPQEPLTQREQIDAVVRDLYDALGNRRPATRHMTDALEKAGLPSSDGTARESRKRVEANEPHLKTLPSALAA
jgi:hypothetical protein